MAARHGFRMSLARDEGFCVRKEISAERKRAFRFAAGSPGDHARIEKGKGHQTRKYAVDRLRAEDWVDAITQGVKWGVLI